MGRFKQLLIKEGRVLQEVRPFLGPESGLLSNTQKRIVWGHMCWQSRRLYWEGAPGERTAGWGNPGGPCHMACSLVFYNGVHLWVVSGQTLWLRVLPAGAFISQPRWIPERRILEGHGDWCLLSPFDLSWILLVGGGLLVPCSLPGSLVLK